MSDAHPAPATAPRSSRGRYTSYRRKIRETPKDDAKADAAKSERPGDVRLGRHQRSTKRVRSFSALFKAYWGLLRGHRASFAGALGLLAVSVVLGLVPLYGSKLVFDVGFGGRPVPAEVPDWLHVPSEPRKLLAFVGTGMVVLALVSTVIGTTSRWTATRIAKRTVVAARRRVFDHAVRLPLHRVYDIKSGGITSLLREDAGGVGELTFSLIYNPFRAVVQLIGVLLVLLVTDWRLCAGAMLLPPVVWFTHRTWIGKIRPIFRDINVTRQGIDAHATESFGGMRVVRSFGRQRGEAGKFTRGNHLMARQEIFAWWWMRGVDAAWGVLIPLATALLMWYGGLRVLEGKLTPGELVMFVGYLGSLLGPIAALAQSATGLQNNLAGLDRAMDLLDEPIEMPKRPGQVEVSKADVRGRLTLRDVTFAYANTDTPVLRDVNLDVRPGEMVALVGPSGAGKTTLCNLIARFYDPTGGQVLLDGTDLRDIDVDSYRRLLGIVEQDTFLFDGTIAENIAYGRRGASMGEIIDAAEKANAHAFVSAMERGYDTYIGERGVKLSGGQRQRLTIARAILADPKILILDEATSNLDTESERLIQSSLAMLMRGRTSFVIAHRLSTIAGADRIAVVDGGRIVEQGTHEELMSRSGRYQQMVLLQTHPHDARRTSGPGAATMPPAAHHGNGHHHE
ncbi:MAG TPA: ABC transporter ATP-binding protein [Tepidisphaeraceae bacterium]|nr:ABC transporter ATP-binding protein [Tepidisphaeraceae bacterium]